ncbi:MAG: hypothetical protein CVU11_13245 [Bacteroidetes bacterium HGW-Bacteroidetes-6]|jgi:hypothetical protein|nr:MAG: hypothetical protein CVU11_13245 [Bacteroidetes bacterium HGW-Bacteroidetes-6]
MKIEINLGTAPNGATIWGIGYDSSITHDKTCGTSVEKKYLDSILPQTASNEEYHYEVAKYVSSMLEEKLSDKNLIFEIEFICQGTSFKKMKL